MAEGGRGESVWATVLRQPWGRYASTWISRLVFAAGVTTVLYPFLGALQRVIELYYDDPWFAIVLLVVYTGLHGVWFWYRVSIGKTP